MTLGRHATSYDLAKVGFEPKGITKIHVRVYETNFFGFKVSLIPMHHPAAALYKAKYRDALFKDFQILKFELEKLGSLRLEMAAVKL